MENIPGPRVSSLAVISCAVAGLLFFIPLLSGLAAVIVGAAALYYIGKSGGLLTGKGLAITGITIGLVQIILIASVSILANFALLPRIYRAPNFHMAEINAHRGRNTEAIAYYKKAIANLKKGEEFRVRENEFLIYNNLGLTYQTIGELDNASVAYKSALEVAKKEMGLAYYGIATVERDQGRFEPATKLLDKAIEYNPYLVTAYQEKAANLRYLGRYEDSVTACKKTIELFPDFAQAHSTLGLAYEKLARYDEATREHIEAIRLNPRRYYPRGRLAYCFSRISDRSLREELLGDLHDVDPQFSDEIRAQLESHAVIKENTFDDLNKDLRVRY
jgi:tetratricopeptide (TPR) repeat protein